MGIIQGRRNSWELDSFPKHLDDLYNKFVFCLLGSIIDYLLDI